MDKKFLALLLALFVMPLHAATVPDPVLDEKTATELRRQADEGDAGAALRLGNLLARNRVPAAKFGNAADWYKKGCALDDLSACHNLGVSYENGRNGVAQDYPEAAAYYLKSAERAFLPSMLSLARLHADSKVIALDNRDGLKWMLIAQKAAGQCAGHRLCDSVLNDEKGYRSRLEARLSPTELQETRHLADVWQPVR